MPALKGKSAFVTGASSGIGRAIALLLAREGCHVFITGQNEARLSAVAQSIRDAGGEVTESAFDLKDSERLSGFVAYAARATGRLDILVNAAGIDCPGTIADGDLSDWREMFDVNVMAVLVASQAAVHQMRDTTGVGHIVTISSYAGQGDGFRVYGATKAAVNSVCKALRKELEDEAIRVITIMPGAVSTNFGRRFPPEYVDKLLSMFGLTPSFDDQQILPDELLTTLHERAAAVFASPDDIARTVLFAVTQPPDVSISEVLVGPRKTFPSHV